MIIFDKERDECQIIDFALPYDTRVDGKEVETFFKYLDMSRELKKVWNSKLEVVPVVIGALGTPAKVLEKRLETTGIETRINELQKTVLLHTGRILQKVLDM